jgi:hypothetical protein
MRSPEEKPISEDFILLKTEVLVCEISRNSNGLTKTSDRCPGRRSDESRYYSSTRVHDQKRMNYKFTEV